MDIKASYHQERLWFIDTFETGKLYEAKPVYHNIPLILSFDGMLDTNVMEMALLKVIQRHEALRTRIVTIDNEPVQQIMDKVEFTLVKREIPDTPEYIDQVIQESKRSFPLEGEPGLLIRGMLFHIGKKQQKSVLLITLHHSIADDYSKRLLTRECLETYTALLQGKEPELGQVQLQYADFSLYQQELPEDIIDSLLLYWRKQLKPPVQPLELPVDFPRANVHTYSEGRCPVAIPSTLTTKIDRFCQNQQIHPSEFLLAAFKILLHRYSGQHEIVLGKSVDNRNQPELQSVVGPVANLLVLRSFISGNDSFNQYFRQLRKTIDQAHEHGDMPFDLLVTLLNPAKDMSRTALFDVLFQYIEEKKPLPEVPGLSCSSIETNLGWGKYDLNLSIVAHKDGSCSGVMVYNKDYYLHESICRMTAHFHRLIESIILNPGEEIGALQILPENEKQCLLFQWNQTSTQYPKDKTINMWFREQVRKSPDAIAVNDSISQITYSQLEKQSDSLARHLSQEGVEHGNIVALLMERSVEMIAAIIAVLKAGAIYLPIDPQYPQDRIDYMIKDSNAVYCYGLDKTSKSTTPYRQNRERHIDDGVYVIYTSGTTGKPKGCMVTHRNVMRLMVNETHPFRFNRKDAWIMAHSYCFDFSVWEMYGALLYGGKLIVPQRQQVQDVSIFHSIVKKYCITILNQTPGAFYHFIQQELENQKQLHSHLRYIIFGGERLEPSKLASWADRYSPEEIALINMYGITETTVHVTFHRLTSQDIREPKSSSPIGTPIPETTVYIMNNHLNLQPVGVTGEIYVGGSGVAKGYLNRPELTAERFITSYLPFPIYKSGDLGCWLANGTLCYQGRSDQQVKIRGFRIELGEIAKHLNSHPSVKESTVIFKKDKRGDGELCAYVIPKQDQAETGKKEWITRLKTHLSKFLPHYMIPSYFVTLDRFPLTSNGKLDINALPEPGTNEDAKDSFQAPTTDLQHSLVEIWADVLGIKTPIGIDDNFFELGGHSLKAAILITALQKKLNVKIHLADIFTNPTIKGLSGIIGETETTSVSTIQPVEKKEYYPVSPAQKRLYILYRMDPHITGYNMPFVMKITGAYDQRRTEETFRSVIERHESFRTSFIMVDNQPVQRVHDSVPFEITEVTEPPETFITPFDLSVAPLLRVVVMKVSQQEHILMLDMHHIISDGSSHPVLLKDFSALYRDETLAPLNIQYKEYCRWQSEHNLEQDEPFWKEKLKAPIPVMNLPYDFVRPPVQDFSGDNIGFIIDKELTGSLKKMALQENATLYMVMLAFLNILLARLSGQNDIIVGSPVAGRSHADLHDLIGMFVNTIVIRNVPVGETSFKHFLSQVKDNTLAAIQHQNYPFELLVEKISLNRDTGRNPLFDVMFVLQNASNREKDSTQKSLDLNVNPMPFETHIAKFDLTLSIEETGDFLSCNFEYCTGLFKAETIQRFISYYQKIIESVTADPSIMVHQIEIIPEQEKEQILSQFNRTYREVPTEKTIHQLFEDQVHKTPDQIALMVKDHQLTYRQFSHQVQRLATSLSQKGISPGMIVAVKMNPIIQMPIALMGVMKAGAAYLPIDPEYPTHRIDYMLKDSNAGALLSWEMGEGKWEINSHVNQANLINQSSDSLAYVIYTSGTTGKPKGVVVEHQSAVNTLLCRNKEFSFKPGDVCLQLFSFSFDGFVIGFFSPVLAGAKVIQPDREQLIDARRLAQIIINNHVSFFICIPALYRLILEQLKPSEARSLRIVSLGGDKVSPDLPAFSAKINPHTELLVEYGVTEVSVSSTIGRNLQPKTQSSLDDTIGIPIWNTQLYILSPKKQLQPIAVPGELHIAGRGVARGYLNRPELTAERFITSGFLFPVSRQPLYKTGDLCCWRPDGAIRFLGRIDHQVKVRGFRIETGEIESILLLHEGISEAVVAAPLGPDGNRYLCAYYVPVENRTLEEDRLKSFLDESLPSYMVPSVYVQIERLPLNAVGKVDRAQLPEPDSKRTADTYIEPKSKIEKQIASVWQEILKIDKVGRNDNFFHLGGNSLNIIQVANGLHDILGKEIPVVILYRHLTVKAIADYILKNQKETVIESPQSVRNNNDIAVIGMAGRFPGAENIHRFWQNLEQGVESITFNTDDTQEKTNYVKSIGGIMPGRDKFDAAFFGYTPREAEVMNPQMRIFHQCAWEALEHAGYSSEHEDHVIGLFAGASNSFYWEAFSRLSGSDEEVGGFQALQLMNKDFLSTRIAYRLNLTGPSFNIQTACSTSLTAVHLACRSIIDRQCHMAMAGGVTIFSEEKNGYIYQEGMIQSPDGHCRAFDTAAGGTVSGEGVGVVVLKALEDAIKDGDTIHAIIKGSAVNNDGFHKAGYTAPGITGQVRVIREALQVSGVHPETVTYVETHGTGTPLGDPIEIESLKLAFNTEKRRFCALGAVKTNVGHLDSAAGITGLIKTVLALKHKKIPATLHFTSPNPQIDFENSPFYVNNTLQTWNSKGFPLRAAVSSFGIGGTNAHVILEEAPIPQKTTVSKEKKHHLLMLSAQTKDALSQMTQNLIDYMVNSSDIHHDTAVSQYVNLENLCYTLQVGRKRFSHRKALVFSSKEEAIHELSDKKSRKVHQLHVTDQNDQPEILFMFPGLGAQYARMGEDLYRNIPAFKEEMDRCFEILETLMDSHPKNILFPQSNSNDDTIHYTWNSQPLLFSFEYALAKLLIRWGIQPDMMIGYSFGEYAAACIAGVFSLEDALNLIVERSRLIKEIHGGGMLSIPATVDEVTPLLPEELTIAIDNGDSVVVSGKEDSITELESQLKNKKVICTRLDTSHAIHSPMMDPILESFHQTVSTIALNPPCIPYISNFTGHLITPHEATSPRYWVNHLRHSVKYASGMNLLIDRDNAILLEVGPGRDLSTLAGRFLQKEKRNHKVVNLVRQPHQKVDDCYYLTGKIGDLWLYGINPSWKAFHGESTPQRIPLPTYPFQEKNYPVSGSLLKNVNLQGIKFKNRTDENDTFKKILKNENVSDWFYLPTWKQSPLKRNFSGTGKSKPDYNWIVFADGPIGDRLVEMLEEQNQPIVKVEPGDYFSRESARQFIINPSEKKDYDNLLSLLKIEKFPPHRIIHAWNISGQNKSKTLNKVSFALDQNIGLYSLVNLVRSLKTKLFSHDIHITVLSDHLQDVTGMEELEPGKSTLLSAVKVISQEYSNIRCRSIDLYLEENTDKDTFHYAEQIIDESSRPVSEPIVALRGPHRWVQGYEPISFDESIQPLPTLRQNGVYLLTGGLGRVGRVLTEELLKQANANVILVGRSPVEPEDSWVEDTMKAHGGQIVFYKADASDYLQMKEVLEQVEQRFGTLNGVIHAAGTTDGKLFTAIDQLQRQHCQAHFEPKVFALLVLHNLLKDKELDFSIITSSLSPVLGGLRFTAYAAANQFMDTFAYWSRKHEGPNWTSINWADWNFKGTPSQDPTDLTMEPSEGAQTFCHVLNHHHFKQIVISTGNLQKRLDRWVNLTTLKEDEKKPKDTSLPLQERPPLLNPYVAPRNPMEEKITSIWQQFFGFEVGVQDDFFELGGDSLKALTLVGKIHRELNVELPVAEMFKNPVIENLAQYISKGNITGEEDVMILLNKENERILFGFPPIVGDGIVYKGLAIEVENVAFYSFNFIEEEDRIQRYIDIMTTIQKNGPYVLFGYSAGGTLAFAITKEMEKQGLEVSDLIFLDVYKTESDPDITEKDVLNFKQHMVSHIDEKRIDFDAYKERIIRNSLEYYKYVRALGCSGEVNANIHLITGMDRSEADYDQWKHSTTKENHVYHGFLDHNDLLDYRYQQQHAELLNSILNNIK